MKINKWLYYFIYALIIAGYITISSIVLSYLVKQNMHGNFFVLSIIVMPLILLILGLLFGAGHLIKEIKSSGRWHVNLPKIIFFVIPSFYFAFGNYFWGYMQNTIFDIIFAPFRYLFQNSEYRLFGYILSVFFGYVLITSFEKVKVSPREMILFVRVISLGGSLA